MGESTVSEVLDKFRGVIEKPYEKLKQWKDAHEVKVVGCSPMHFPEEMIHAAGMLPVVLQETEEPVTEGFSLVHPFFCGITRNIIDVGAKGGLHFFDGLIFNDICIQSRNAAFTLKRILPEAFPLFLFQFPTFQDRETVREDAMRELEKMRKNIENLADRRIDEGDLARSIALFNQNRDFLRRFHDWCLRNPRGLAFRDRQAVVRASMLTPKEEHCELMASLLKGLDQMNPPSFEGKGLFVSGHLCQSPKTAILDLIEGTGATVVDDDLYTGYRYYALDAGTEAGPMEAITGRMLDRSIPVPTRSEGVLRWGEYVVERAKYCRAQGVVVLIAKYCEPHLFQYPFIKSALNAAGIPHIMLETEPEVVSLEGMRTRLQAFLEMLD